jgi:hypothetical protein
MPYLNSSLVDFMLTDLDFISIFFSGSKGRGVKASMEWAYQDHEVCIFPQNLGFADGALMTQYSGR